MDKLNKLNHKQFAFAALLILANKLDASLEREMSRFGMTAKQWFLTGAIENLFEYPPTINEVAKAMGYSHQNVKQVALKLEKKGFLKLEKDSRDARATRLVLTEKNYNFWAEVQESGSKFNDAVFNGISEEEIVPVRKVLEKVWENLTGMEDV